MENKDKAFDVLHNWGYKLTNKKIFFKINIFRNLISKIKYWKFCINDYNRLEHYCSCILCHASIGNMSKTNYDLNTVYSVIDTAQDDFHFNIIKDDLNSIIKDGGTIEDIKEYINRL